MDVRGEALIGGHVVASVARNLLSVALVVVVAVAIGFRPHADVAHWLLAAGVLVLFVLALSWFAAAIGIAARTSEMAQGIAFLVSFLPYVSRRSSRSTRCRRRSRPWPATNPRPP